MGIEPTLSAWKAEVLPLNYTRKLIKTNGGGGRIRTSEAEAADLQSAPFDRSGIPPKPSGELSYAAVQGVNTPDTRIVEERKLIGELIWIKVRES